MNDKDLDKIKKIELDVLKYFMEVCEKHNLTYYIFFGTLIGCIRHKGFIPWDDDIDVVMPPEDYLKLMKIMETEKDDTYYFQNITNTKYCSYVFSKIRKYHTTMVETDMNYLPFKKGINIDVFPLLRYPKTKLRQKLFMFRYRLSALLVNRDIKAKTVSKKILFGLLHILPRTLTNKIVIHNMNKLITYKGDFDYYRVAYNQCLDKNWFKKMTKPFENIEVIIPEGYDAALTNLYGDYMTPPPEEERHGHGGGKLILSFDKEYDEL